MKTAKDTNFYDKVYAVVRLVPKGRVTTYGAVAKFLSLESAARMVGQAMNHSHTALPAVPAQRVVNRAGILTGKHHFGGTLMEQLLTNEGVEVFNDRVKGFKDVFWDPSIELLGTE